MITSGKSLVNAVLLGHAIMSVQIMSARTLLGMLMPSMCLDYCGTIPLIVDLEVFVWAWRFLMSEAAWLGLTWVLEVGFALFRCSTLIRLCLGVRLYVRKKESIKS